MRNCGSDPSQPCRSESERPTHRPFLVPTRTTASLTRTSRCTDHAAQVNGPAHGVKLTGRASAFVGELRRAEPDGGVAGQLAGVQRGAGQQHIAPRKRDWLGPEVGHAPYATGSLEAQHMRLRLDPAEVAANKQLAAERDRLAVKIERGVGISLLDADRVAAEPVRLRQMRA